MRKPKKASRNRQRKALYAAKADLSSRNQTPLEGPYVGHFETVTRETRHVLGSGGEVVREYEVEVRPYQRIVHDEGAGGGGRGR